MATLTELQYGLYETIEHNDYTSYLFFDFQNKRLKIRKYQGDIHRMIRNTMELCGKYQLGKILATVPEDDRQVFLAHGFVQEAKSDGFFRGKDGYNVSYFYDHSRALSLRKSEEDEIIKTVKAYQGQYQPLENSYFSFRTATAEDAEKLAVLYDTVFQTYPTPMDNADYISNIIINNEVIFKIAEYDKRIVSAASAELNHELLNAEITDCATYQDFRGKGLLSELVYYLEVSLQEMNFITLFSVARAISHGINIVFSKHGYRYSGRQINNSQIMGKLEDMNIWVKRLNLN